VSRSPHANGNAGGQDDQLVILIILIILVKQRT
jgi:hypothetical protein